MEPWFWWVVAGMILAGIHVFIQRIGSARGYRSNVLNTYSALVSGVIGICIGLWLEGWQEITFWMVVIAVVNGTVYLVGSNLRMDAMKHIDTTILLPLHKFVSPLFALIIGVLFLQEVLEVTEWWGILLGAIVPLLLITRSENARQPNLSKGLWLMTISAFIVVVNAAINKEAVLAFESVILFAAISHLGSAPLGIIASRIRSHREKGQENLISDFNPELLRLALICGVVQFASFTAFLYAFAFNGPLAVVYTIHSLYILIPIILSIIFFNEHWNTRKVIAIVASVAAILLMR
jgi:drug/metabolite transporter (DMT)-like permease